MQTNKHQCSPPNHVHRMTCSFANEDLEVDAEVNVEVDVEVEDVEVDVEDVEVEDVAGTFDIDLT